MAIALAIIIWLIALIVVLFFAGGFAALPPLISHYQGIDEQFRRTLLITGTVFILFHLLLGYFIWRYRERSGIRAFYAPGSLRIETVCAIIVAASFLVIAGWSQRAWTELRLTSAPADAVIIEVTAYQFAWVFRYPGADGKFGAIKLTAIDRDHNPLSIDAGDSAGRDDLVSVGTLIVPADRPVHLLLRSQDVIHSLFIPPLRIKQDAVPGFLVPVDFTAARVGEYEIACAELCGSGHYKMRARLQIVSSDEFNRWLQTQSIAH